MATLVTSPMEYGNALSFWVEYPTGLVDLSRSHHLCASQPPLELGQADIAVDGGRTIRINTAKTAVVIVDMQNYFLHPDMRDHPKGLACVDPLINVVSTLRPLGIKMIWLNWGLTDHELQNIPPTLVRGFMRKGRGGFGAELPGKFGRLLMRGEVNSDLYGPLQDEFIRGRDAGTDIWIHKNRISGLWGYQSALDLYLKENGLTTLFFAGVNTDQCVLGTMADAYHRGYDCILVKDATATTSPHGLESVLHNAENTYGFVTDSTRLVAAQSELLKH